MKIEILYGSSRGRTKDLAFRIAQRLEDLGRVRLWDVKNPPEDEILTECALLLVGSSTWENGDLQRDFYHYEKHFSTLKFQGIRAAAFGTGSIVYHHFCQAVDILEVELKNQGAHLIVPGLRLPDFQEDREHIFSLWLETLRENFFRQN